MRKAIGLIAGPESPPVIFASFGRRFSISITMPVIVFINDIESAPASSTLRAISVISVTLGVSFTMTGLPVLPLTAFTTLKPASGLVPNATPPAFTLGHEILTSIPAISSISSMRDASSAYSRISFP